jgi:hypothetical protein
MVVVYRTFNAVEVGSIPTRLTKSMGVWQNGYASDS